MLVIIAVTVFIVILVGVVMVCGVSLGRPFRADVGGVGGLVLHRIAVSGLGL
jgi:hypothetical protein